MLCFIFAILGIGTILFMLTPYYYLLSQLKLNQKKATFIKGLNTLISFLFCIVGLLRLQNCSHTMFSSFFCWFLVSGMLLCVFADITLEYNVLIGGILFFLGHLCYLLFFITIAPFHNVSMLIATLLAVLLLCLFYPFTPRMEPLTYPIMAYGLLLCISLSIGILLPFSLKQFGILPAIAILLLVISDILLAIYHFVIDRAIVRKWALYTYFVGQYLMAMTFFLPSCN